MYYKFISSICVRVRKDLQSTSFSGLATTPCASSGVVTRNTTLPASRPPLENSSATTDEIIVHGSNEDANPGSFEGVSALAAATRVHKGKCHLMSARTLWHLKQSVGTAM